MMRSLRGFLPTVQNKDLIFCTFTWSLPHVHTVLAKSEAFSLIQKTSFSAYQQTGDMEPILTWQFLVTFLGWWKRDPLNGYIRTLQLGDTKVTLNHLESDNSSCPPAQDASHHQDYYVFRIGDPNLPTFICHDCILGGGTTQFMCASHLLSCLLPQLTKNKFFEKITRFISGAKLFSWPKRRTVTIFVFNSGVSGKKSLQHSLLFSGPYPSSCYVNSHFRTLLAMNRRGPRN